jgi:AcrR family transcriptional regulator
MAVSIEKDGDKSLPPTRKGKATRERLLEAATEVFGRLGYEATRVADINEAAGISHGLFYRHFKDKAEILIAVLERMNAQLRHTSGREVGEEGPVTLAQLERRNIQFFHEYAQNRLLLRVAREVAARNDEEEFREMWLRLRQRYVDRTQRLLTQLAANGEITPIPDSKFVAAGLSALTEQLAYVEIGLAEIEPTGADIERLGKAVALIWFRTIQGQAT